MTATMTGAPSAPSGEAALSLFNSAAFHGVTLGGRATRLEIVHESQGHVVGSFVAVRVGDEACNGYSAPFGGIDLAREEESLDNILALVAETCGRLDDAGVSTIRVRARPDCYSPIEPKVQFALLANGFAVESVELNQHIPLAGLARVNDYVDGLSRRGRRAIRYGRAQGLVFSEATEPERRAEAYAVLLANRSAKARPLRLSFTYLENLRAALPGRVRTFVELAAGRVCAAAVVYLVRPAAWLVVYWGDAGHELEHSPMNVLAYDLVERALDERIGLIDLGISSESGVPNVGLALFKEIVGARSGLRIALVRRAAA